jgi:antitoxin PrlF
MITATLTSKGQITVPVAVRNALNLDTGDRLTFDEIRPGEFLLKTAQKTSVKSLKNIFGKSPRKVSVAKMNAAIAKRGGNIL